MARWIFVAAALALSGCPGEVVPPVPPPVEPAKLAHCLDRPGTLERAPSDQLPCELLPPGFGK